MRSRLLFICLALTLAAPVFADDKKENTAAVPAKKNPERHEKFLKDIKDMGTVNVAFLGDSITDGNTYPTMIKQALAEAGLKVAVTPAGRPLAVSATAPVKVPVRVIETVPVALVPGLSVTEVELSESEKSLVGVEPMSP
jgi:hypothetical protein